MRRPSPWPNQRSVGGNICHSLGFANNFCLYTARSSLDGAQSAIFCHRCKNKSLAFECHFDLDLAWSVLRPKAGHSCFNFLLQKKNEDQPNYWSGQNWRVHQSGTICAISQKNSTDFTPSSMMGEIKNNNHANCALTSSIRLSLPSIFHKSHFLLVKCHTLFLWNPQYCLWAACSA